MTAPEDQNGLREALARAEAGGHYGIIDPDYARVFTVSRCIAWAEGYALMMHGSFTRDLDVIAVPWTEDACEPEHLARRIEDAAGLKLTAGGPGRKPHGRLAWTLLFPGFSDPRFVDLSVMPRALAAEAEITRLKEGMEALGAKAEGQITYWRERQAAEKALEDGVSEDGLTYTPMGDHAAWQAGYCNGRMSEADWWLWTLKSLATLSPKEQPHG